MYPFALTFHQRRLFPKQLQSKVIKVNLQLGVSPGDVRFYPGDGYLIVSIASPSRIQRLLDFYG